jgi:hypothetical protein
MRELGLSATGAESGYRTDTPARGLSPPPNALLLVLFSGKQHGAMSRNTQNHGWSKPPTFRLSKWKLKPTRQTASVRRGHRSARTTR